MTGTVPIHALKDSAKTHRWIASALAAPSDDCIEWPFFRDGSGYGAMRLGGNIHPATHVALTLAGFPRPGGAFALHACDNPPCVNPSHLRWGSPQENSQDAIDRGRVHGLAESEREQLVTLPAGDSRHGKPTTYTNYRCRCRPCTDAHTAYYRNLREQRATGANAIPTGDGRRVWHIAVRELINRHVDEFESIRTDLLQQAEAS